MAQAGHSAMAKVLIKAGASLEAANRDGRTPLMMAARTNRAETVQALAEAGASLTATDRRVPEKGIVDAVSAFCQRSCSSRTLKTSFFWLFHPKVRLSPAGPQKQVSGAALATALFPRCLPRLSATSNP